jgi:tetratricopeptide (TPR) repeat protein
MTCLLDKLFSLSRAWDISTRIAFGLALTLLVISLIIMRFGPPDVRQPALIGFIGLIIVNQVIFMWGNRHMVTPYTRAQRRYLAEDFDGARIILEQLQESGAADVSALTLLANTYRQLGLLHESEEIVRKALLLKPSDHFPLYSLGRTLLVAGKYDEAVLALRQAVEAGAPEIVEFDLGEALYRAGNVPDARIVLRRVRQMNQEVFRRLMTAYLLYRMGDDAPPGPEVMRTGLTYWQSAAQRFHHTAYGQRLADDVREIQMLLEVT